MGGHGLLRDDRIVDDADAAGAGGRLDARLFALFEQDGEHVLIDLFRALQAGHLDGALDQLGVLAAVGGHLALEKALAVAQHVELQLLLDAVLADLLPEVLVEIGAGVLGGRGRQNGLIELVAHLVDLLVEGDRPGAALRRGRQLRALLDKLVELPAQLLGARGVDVVQFRGVGRLEIAETLVVGGDVGLGQVFRIGVAVDRGQVNDRITGGGELSQP
ncbi:MAG: hypothetical protein BWY77_01846 [bacterium ADurb.Bin431]|nr:MAG: hypothetical protein BWY77_01846 [bacterium ADurb.Bin431]